MVLVTGDIHGNTDRLERIANRINLTSKDVIIILGDAAFNYFCDTNSKGNDYFAKRRANNLGCTIFCIHGNHEARPHTINSYKTKEYNNGIVWYEDEFPNLLFAKDGEIYKFNDYNCLVIGGAYSIDKHVRISRGGRWFSDEQPSIEIKDFVKNAIKHNDSIDIVFTHTCPSEFEPTEMFISGFDESSIDRSTELWLDDIETAVSYKKWYCGHFHTNKTINTSKGKMRFMFDDVEELSINND